MAIKNKDGSIYRLKGPNPLVKEQSWPKPEEVAYYNFTWPEIRLEDEVQIITQLSTPQPPPEKTPATKITPIQEKTKFKNVVLVYCLPVITTQKSDPLYGDSYEKTEYGEKFSFEAMLLERNDLSITLWTNHTMSTPNGPVNTAEYITKNSIIYPAKYADGARFGDFRWWKIDTMLPQHNGLSIRAVITSVQPSFQE